MKKAIVKTKIYEWLDIQEAAGKNIDANFVMENLQLLWEYLQQQPDDLLENAKFEIFKTAAIQEYQSAPFKQQMRNVYEQFESRRPS